ncbi:cytochrome c oxidase subunit 6C [Sitophilus oryzae]|uniref:Cytochrome c oxidase subunit 6C n=1 Tax=Sitophilus oryzae TaxID=7048 RepID=A0A6J2Y7D0_SITOR|nr:cytochrome c oxidase subunit 6C [Sitophilus oryzae]
MSQVTSPLKRPQLRGLLHSAIKRNLIIIGVTLVTAGTAFQIFHNDARKQKYAEFYKNYDIDKECEEIRKKGLFDSCPSD